MEQFEKITMSQPKEYSPTVTAVLCLLLGSLGVHRFYVGDTKFGLIYLFTRGFLFVGVIVDLILLASGKFKDGNKNYIGKPQLLPVILWSAAILALFMLVLAIILMIVSAINKN